MTWRHIHLQATCQKNKKVNSGRPSLTSSKTPLIRWPTQTNFHCSGRVVLKKSVGNTFQAQFDCVTTGTIAIKKFGKESRKHQYSSYRSIYFSLTLEVKPNILFNSFVVITLLLEGKPLKGGDSWVAGDRISVSLHFSFFLLCCLIEWW